MDDLDSWMKGYINRHRLKFIETMMTDWFIQGFPGLQDYIRNRAKCMYHQSGYFNANVELIDYIVKIDDFSDKFINFCEKHGINEELVRIVRAGHQEYYSKFGRRSDHNVSQKLTTDKNDHHSERALPSFAPGKRDQISTSLLNLAQSRDLNQSQNDNIANLIVACDNIESTNSGSVSHESRNETTVDGVDAGCLSNCLECTVSGLEGAEATLENPSPRPSDENGVSTEDNNFNENNARGEHRHELKASSSSSNNINVQSVENELKTSDINMLRSKTVPLSCEKNMDKLTNEGTAPVCDPNLDRREMEKTSHGDKKKFMAERATSSDGNASNERNSPTDEITSARNNGDLKHNVKKNNTDNQYQVGPVNKENTFLGESPNNKSQNGNNNNNQSESPLGSTLETWESFYLSSSDEEDLLPTQSLEIDSLKEIPKLSSTLDEPVQRFHSLEVTSNNDIRVGPSETSAFAGDTFQREGPLKTPAVGGDTFQRNGPFHTPAVAGETFQRDGPSETSKVKFTMLSTGLSGVECQEDIDRFKTNIQMEKRVENNVLNDESRKHEGAILEFTGSPSSLTESMLSETSVKEVIEMTEAVPQQQACEENLTLYDYYDFRSLHNTLGISNEQKSIGVARDSGGGNSLSLSVDSFPASSYSESSKGFEFDDALASDVKEVVGSDVESNDGSSDHVSEGSQSFERDMPIVEPPNIQISRSSDIFPQNDGFDYITNISEPSQHSSENSSQEHTQNNNSTPSNVTASNITVLVAQARRIIEMYFPELCIRL